MRVADSTTFGNIIFYLQRAQVRQAELQQQLSSGKRIGSPSDDPIAFGQAVHYHPPLTTIATPSAGAPVTITATSNDTLAVKVDGISSGTLSLTAGTYVSGDALAAEVQAKINADATLAAAGKAVSVSFQTNHLVIASNS